MSRPVVGSAKDRQLVVRLPAELRQRVEAIRTGLTRRAGNVDQVTSHVMRQIIERGCESMERDLKA
jgi:predicted DNA-binding protein